MAVDRPCMRALGVLSWSAAGRRSEPFGNNSGSESEQMELSSSEMGAAGQEKWGSRGRSEEHSVFCLIQEIRLT